MSQVIDNIVNMNNYIYQNNSVRMMLFIISGVFLGYTLEPIPKTLEKLFKNSNIFKFIILFVTACIYVYPLNIQHLINIVVCSILALVIFEGIRIYDKYVEEKEKEINNYDLAKIFEYYSCIQLSKKYNQNYYEYNDIDPSFKENNKMSRTDTGIDACNLIDTIIYLIKNKDFTEAEKITTEILESPTASDEIKNRVNNLKSLINN